MIKGLKLFFYILFILDVVIGILLSVFLNTIVGITAVCVLLFINIVTFVVILKIEKKRNDVTNKKF